MTRKDKLVFRVKSLILKYRMKGKFLLAIKIRDMFKGMK